MNEQERNLTVVQNAIEQTTETLRLMVAPAVASYYKALRSEGVVRSDAATLALGLQERYLAAFMGTLGV